MKITFYILTILMLVVSFGPGNAEAKGIRIDHVIVAVHNISNASETFKNLGFTIKPGRIHENGLLNAHIKFQNQTELELMSVIGTGKDSVSKGYAKFLERGEGGAFLALSGPSMKQIVEVLNRLKLEYKIVRGALWDYVVFPDGSGLEHLFFINMHKTRKDDEWVYNHGNGAKMINRIWVEGGATFERLLKGMGARDCGLSSRTVSPPGKIYETTSGDIVVVPLETKHSRPRILGIAFEMNPRENEPIPIAPNTAHGIWIEMSDRWEADECLNTGN